jgi:hypothetical protein
LQLNFKVLLLQDLVEQHRRLQDGAAELEKELAAQAGQLAAREQELAAARDAGGRAQAQVDQQALDIQVTRISPAIRVFGLRRFMSPKLDFTGVQRTTEN